MARLLRLVSVVLTLAVIAAACSDDDSGPAPGAAPSAPGPSTTAPPPASTTAPTTVVVTTAPEPTTVTPPATTAPSPAVGPFEIHTPDGLVLEAERFGVGEDFVVLAHMRPSDQASWFSFAGLLAGEGYTAITFNFRGYGNSDGAGFAVDVDIVAAVDAAFELGARRVFVMGASMGGTAAIAASDRREIAGVVSLSAPSEFMGVDAVAAARSGVPMLLVAAQDDAPYNTHAELLGATATGLNEVMILSGRKHGTDLFLDHSETLVQAIVAFLAAA